MKKIILVVFYLTIIMAQQSDIVPYGKNILVNGIYSIPEWSDSKSISPDSTIEISFKQDSTYLYLAVLYKKEKHTGIDLYLGDNKRPFAMLHVSATKGEKFYTETGWNETLWKLTKQWTANTVGLFRNNEGKRKIIEPEVTEFQINKNFFPNKKINFRIHLKRPEKIFPENTSDTNTKNWYKLILN